MKIAIDGPSGSGKSSIAKAIAKKLNIFHLDTGAMYRMLGYKIYKEGKKVEDALSLLDDLDIRIVNSNFLLDGEDVSAKIRENEISKLASEVSKIKEVREYMVSLQRKISSDNNVILDGRDIGTVVFPDAEIKIYLTASPEVRAKRRQLEDTKVPFDVILKDIIKRDFEDMHRENSPLKKADDAIEIDTDNLSFDEVVEKILGIIEKYESRSNN